jgi:hypothetical protein
MDVPQPAWDINQRALLTLRARGPCIRRLHESTHPRSVGVVGHAEGHGRHGIWGVGERGVRVSKEVIMSAAAASREFSCERQTY